MTNPRDIDRLNMTADYVRELFTYDADTGVLRWKTSKRRGRQAGCLHHLGYLQIRQGGHSYFAHRLAWLHFYGEWPKQFIDHIDRDKTNNRIANLRDIGREENRQNVGRASKRNICGWLGVSLTKWGFRASIKVAKKYISLGFFDTAAEAHGAYIEAKRRHHPGFIGVDSCKGE